MAYYYLYDVFFFRKRKLLFHVSSNPEVRKFSYGVTLRRRSRGNFLLDRFFLTSTADR